jgi:hypothetical protein
MSELYKLDRSLRSSDNKLEKSCEYVSVFDVTLRIVPAILKKVQNLKMKSGIDVVLSSEQISDLKDAFHALDTEGEGQIELRDLKVAIRALGFEVQKDEISKILNELDRMAADESRPPRIPNGMIPHFSELPSPRPYLARDIR